MQFNAALEQFAGLGAQVIGEPGEVRASAIVGLARDGWLLA